MRPRWSSAASLTGDQPGTPVAGAAETTTGASVARGGAWNAVGVLAPQANALIVSIVAAHALGADLFGRQSFIAFVELTVVFVLTDSLYTALVRSIGTALGSGRDAAIRPLVRWAWTVEVLAAVAGGGVLVVTALAGASHGAAWVLAGAACAFGILNAVPGAFLVGMQRWRASSTMWLVLSVAATLATIVVLEAGGGITGMFLVEAVSSAAHLVWASVLLRGLLPHGSGSHTGFADPGGLRRDVARYAASLLPQAVLIIVVSRRSEFFFLNASAGDREIGLYSVAFAFVTALSRIPTSMAFALVPAIATLQSGGLERIRRGLDRGLRLLLLVTLPLSAFAVSLGPRFLQLVYPAGFHGAEAVLVILLISLPASPFAGLGSSLVSGLGRARPALTANALAAAVDISLAALLCAPYGAIGAAIANASGQVTFSLVLAIVWARTTGGVLSASQWLAVARCVLASAGAGAVAWAVAHGVSATGDWPGNWHWQDAAALAVATIAGLVTLGLLAWGLRIVPVEDTDWLETRLGGLLGGRPARFARRCAIANGV
jgi:O-antigen/teichoic acid export membrane protein